MTRDSFRIGEAAELLGVSPDTMRRWADSGRLATTRTPAGHRTVTGKELARLATQFDDPGDVPGRASARNRFRGIVTKVLRDKVMAQVEIQSGPHRFVSLMSREAADDLELEPGKMAVATVKATTVIVELPDR